MNAFVSTARKLQSSRYIIPITLIVLAGVGISLVASYEDYMSTLRGYEMLPTRKTGHEVIMIIALLPQVGQIISFYLFGSTIEVTSKGYRRINYIYFIVASFLLLFDVGTDMYFKASGLPLYVWVIAFVESITVYTVGSEMLLTASAGLFLELLPMALKQAGQVLASFIPVDDDEGIEVNINGMRQRPVPGDTKAVKTG